MVAADLDIYVDAPLNEREQRIKERLERTVDNHLKSFVKVGIALNYIKENRLWREDFETWTEYLLHRFDLSPQRARQLRLASETQLMLYDVTDVTLPNESVARQLRRYDDDLQPTIAKIARARSKSDNSPITAPMIRAIGDTLKETSTNGYIDTGSGESTTFEAALTAAEAEAYKTDSQYIQDRIEKSLAKKQRKRVAYNVPGRVIAIGQNGCITIEIDSVNQPVKLEQLIYVTVEIEEIS